MIDLTEIDVPFGELDDETKTALVAAAYVHREVVCMRTARGRWATLSYPTFRRNEVYRLEKTMSSINWDHVHPDYKYLRRTELGDVYLYTHKPYLSKDGGWWCVVSMKNSLCQRAAAFLSLQVGDVSWDKDICDRPEVSDE